MPRHRFGDRPLAIALAKVIQLLACGAGSPGTEGKAESEESSVRFGGVSDVSHLEVPQSGLSRAITLRQRTFSGAICTKKEDVWIR